MKRVLVKSVYDAFDYVMAHYYPCGLEEMAEKKDPYAVISIQDTHTQGFGIQFTKSESCADVLTLYFDDIDKEVPGAVLFSDAMAEQVFEFVEANRNVDTLLIHCYAGQSRSRAVGAFIVRMLGADNTKYFKNGTPNQHVYDTLESVWIRRMSVTGKIDNLLLIALKYEKFYISCYNIKREKLYEFAWEVFTELKDRLK